MCRGRQSINKAVFWSALFAPLDPSPECRFFPCLLHYHSPDARPVQNCDRTHTKAKGNYCEKYVQRTRLERIEGNVHNGIWKLSPPAFIVSPSFSKQPSLFSAIRAKFSEGENEVHSCILREAFKVEYSSNKKECELQLAWVWFNVCDLGVQNSRMLRKWIKPAIKHIPATMPGDLLLFINTFCPWH